MSRARLGVAVVAALAVLAAPAMAATATLSVDGASEVQPGDTVTYTFSVTNTGENESGYLLNITRPNGWEIVDQNSESGWWKENETTWIVRSIEPGSTREPSLTFSVPDSASDGTVEVAVYLNSTEDFEDTTAKSVTVEADDGGGGGGGSDDDGGGGGGGSDDDSGSDDDGGSDDDSGSNDIWNGDDSDDGADNDGGSGGTSDDQAGFDDLYGDNSTSDDGTNSTDGATNGTDDTDEQSATTPESDQSGTERGAATERTTESTSNEDAETETGSGDTESGSDNAVGLGLGVLLVLATGAGVVTARRDALEESVVGGLLDDETDADRDYGDIDVDVVDFQFGADECSLRYVTEQTSNKAMGDEIREIARGYASADADDIDAQRLDATVTDGSQRVATWHIRTEWLEQLEDGTFSEDEFELAVLGTHDLEE